jgi:hypothetical protein
MTTTSAIDSVSSVLSSIEGMIVFFDQSADGPPTGNFASLAESPLNSSLRRLLSTVAPDEALPKLALENSNVNEVESFLL